MKINRTEPIYQKIANKLEALIPVEWMNIYLYAEGCKNSVEVHFFFEPLNETGRFVYYQDIPDNYTILKGEFSQNLMELFQLIFRLRGGFSNYTTKIWTSVSIIVKKNGEFLIDYDLSELSNCNDENRRLEWLKQTLGSCVDELNVRKFLNV